MDLDATINSHPIIQTVEHPDQITEIFDTISYSKGAAVLRYNEVSQLYSYSFKWFLPYYTVTWHNLSICLERTTYVNRMGPLKLNGLILE
jgi:hypothetical protein